MYQPLNEQSVVNYVRGLPDVMQTVFYPDDVLYGVDLADGNVNLVFRVLAAADPVGRSVIVKQALPYARIVGESFPMPLERSHIEAKVLRLQRKVAPHSVPRIYHHDPDDYTIVMQDLSRHIILRKGLIARTIYPNLAEQIGIFLAATLFYHSDLFLAHDVKKQAAADLINPALCKVTEDLVFTDPYTSNDGNVWNRLLDPQVEAIRADERLRGELFWLKETFMTKAETLLHGDLHTGSIMANSSETIVIDPEFAFYGPMAFDTGLLLANLAISVIAHDALTADPDERRGYQGWLLNVMRHTWQNFEREFRRLWKLHLHTQWATDRFREKYVLRLLQQTAGFGAAEIMRRVLGLAHVADFNVIADDAARARVESRALDAACAWLFNYPSYHTIEDLVRAVERSTSRYPYTTQAD